MKACTGPRPRPGGGARCSFCGDGRIEATILISGQSGIICCACAAAIQRLLQADIDCRYPAWLGRTPAEIKAALDGAVVGQESAKRVLSVALYNHYKRLTDYRRHETEIAKSNVLLIGPPGTGKTLLARILADIAEVPFVIVDATTFTETGYVGADVESILLRLLRAVDYDVDEAQAGIVFIDEIDKIARKAAPQASGRDIGGEGVQRGLLRLIEGGLVMVPADIGRHGRRAFLEIDTTNILFIASGTFAGLEELVLKREGSAPMGYGRTLPHATGSIGEVLRRVRPEDLIAFGFLPEFIGRFPIAAALDELDEADLVEILTRPQNALVKQYQLLFRLNGVDLQFEDAALRTIAHRAIERGTGARGLRAVVELLLLDLMFELPDSTRIRKIVVDRETAEQGVTRLLLESGDPSAPGPESRARWHLPAYLAAPRMSIKGRRFPRSDD